MPVFALFAIPNGGARHVATAVKLKREGVRKGVADLHLLAARKGYHGLFLELKWNKNKQSIEQKEFEAYCLANGYLYKTAYTLEVAIVIIQDYLGA